MAATTSTIFADDKDCKKNDGDNNCNDAKKIQKSSPKAECEVDTQIKDHNKNSVVGPIDLQCSSSSQSLIDSNIQSSPSDGGNGNIGDEEPQITLEPNSGGTGTRVVVSGTGWQGGLDIAITFDGINVATANGADNNGEFTTSFNVPGDATAGDHTVLAAQFLDFDCCQASATFTVTS